MEIYQINVVGDSAVFESSFRMSSRKVYKREPTQKEIDEFIKKCADETYFDYLDINNPYQIKILHLNLIED